MGNKPRVLASKYEDGAWDFASINAEMRSGRTQAGLHRRLLFLCGELGCDRDSLHQWAKASALKKLRSRLSQAEFDRMMASRASRAAAIDAAAAAAAVAARGQLAFCSPVVPPASASASSSNTPNAPTAASSLLLQLSASRAQEQQSENSMNAANVATSSSFPVNGNFTKKEE